MAYKLIWFSSNFPFALRAPIFFELRAPWYEHPRRQPNPRLSLATAPRPNRHSDLGNQDRLDGLKHVLSFYALVRSDQPQDRA
jgi:hypothetical protein